VIATITESAAEFQAPSFEYSLLSPLLVIFGVAIAGVLV
jgi:hypothetical protein